MVTIRPRVRRNNRKATKSTTLQIDSSCRRFIRKHTHCLTVVRPHPKLLTPAVQANTSPVYHTQQNTCTWVQSILTKSWGTEMACCTYVYSYPPTLPSTFLAATIPKSKHHTGRNTCCAACGIQAARWGAAKSYYCKTCKHTSCKQISASHRCTSHIPSHMSLANTGTSTPSHTHNVVTLVQYPGWEPCTTHLSLHHTHSQCLHLTKKRIPTTCVRTHPVRFLRQAV